MLDYVITNKKTYIKLSNNGVPETCEKNQAQRFEYSKARNILDNLPKTMKKFHFTVQGIPEIIPKNTEVERERGKEVEKQSIHEDYIPPDSILMWIDKFGECSDIVEKAKLRKRELKKELINVNKQICNIEHSIEFGGKIDLYGGWLERNMIQTVRKKRRDIKNEIFIISSILKTDFKDLNSENLKKLVDSLSHRKYTYRIVEEDDVENVV